MSVLSSLIEKYAPDSNVLTLRYPSNDPENPFVFKFKIIVDATETNALLKSAAVWITQRREQVSRKILPKASLEWHTDDTEVLGQAFCLSSLSLDEEFQKVDSWLRLAKKCGGLFGGIWAQVDGAAIQDRDQLLQAVIMKEKKDLKTPPIEPG